MMMIANSCPVHRNRDIYGRVVQRTIKQYPYSFENTAIWKGDNFKKTTDSVDSDRLVMWNSDLFSECCERVWGNNKTTFTDRNPESIEVFLREYFGQELNLTGIEIACNAMTGYPYWTFYFEIPGKSITHD